MRNFFHSFSHFMIDFLCAAFFVFIVGFSVVAVFKIAIIAVR